MDSLGWLFLILACLVFYIYLGYPIILFVASRLLGVGKVVDDTYEPTVTLLIAAYNEKDYIAKKIENSLKLEYPRKKLEIIVFSDGSDDGTDEVVREYEKKGVKLLRVEGRLGKTSCQNKSVKKSKGEIIIFTDTKSILNKSAVRKIVQNFSNKKIGSVGGVVKYTNDKGSLKEGAYIRFEQAIRNMESELFGTTATAGALYAVRKREYVALPDYAQSDFLEPISIYLKHNKRPIIEEGAIAQNMSAGTSGGEFKRHERIITRYHFSKNIIRGAYNPFNLRAFSLALISHKSLRFYAPLFLLLLMSINIALSFGDVFWRFVLAIHLAVYLFAFIGYLLDKKKKSFFVFSVPYHFVILNLAAGKAWYNYLKGRNFVTWENKKA